MKILIDGQTLLTPEINRGIGVYFRRVIEHMLASQVTNDFFIIGPRPEELSCLSVWAREQLICIPDNDGVRGRGQSASRAYSDWVNQTIRDLKLDVYWSPNPLMLNVFLPGNENSACRFAATIFDLIPLVMENHFRKHWSSKNLGQYKEKLRLLESDYDLFLHISKHTESDFLRALSVSTKKHHAIPLAADEAFQPYPFPKIPHAKNYVLYPGGFDPRKNMDRALEAFAAMKRKYRSEGSVAQADLVIVCHKDRASHAEAHRRARKLDIAEHLRLTGFVSTSRLVALYQQARCLFFPSLYEGFGLPLVEALACGLPIACSNTSSLPEVAGEFAHYFDPEDIDGMADALFKALTDHIDIQARTQRRRHAKLFSWQQTARATLNAFADATQAVTRVRTTSAR